MTAVDAPIGRVCCTVSGSLASYLKPKERILSLSVNNIILDLCCATSYRNTVDIANNVYNRDDDNRFRVHTINDRIETIGNAISKDGGSKDGKVVENTVIHIQSKEGVYIITAVGMGKAFRILLAFLLKNHLLENRHLYFFSDGARNIRKGIKDYFAFCPPQAYA